MSSSWLIPHRSTLRNQRGRGRIIPHVFHRKGKPITDFRSAWRNACLAAGVIRIPHDFRRTAVRNLERAGVSRSVAMKLVGHKTEAIYRYAIADEQSLREAAVKLAAASDLGKVLGKVAPVDRAGVS